MPVYEIAAVGNTVRDWESTKGGPMKSYRVELKDAANILTSNVEWARKATSPPPTIGQKVDGTIDTSGEYGPKFKSTPSSGFSGGGGPRPRDPKESAQIIQQHSQRMALDYARLQHDRGALPDNFALEQVLIIAGKFADDAKAATP
jgi:hypothetical protein